MSVIKPLVTSIIRNFSRHPVSVQGTWISDRELVIEIVDSVGSAAEVPAGVDIRPLVENIDSPRAVIRDLLNALEWSDKTYCSDYAEGVMERARKLLDSLPVEGCE